MSRRTTKQRRSATARRRLYAVISKALPLPPGHRLRLDLQARCWWEEIPVAPYVDPWWLDGYSHRAAPVIICGLENLS